MAGSGRLSEAMIADCKSSGALWTAARAGRCIPFASGERWGATGSTKRRLDLVDELGAQFATNSPRQPALARLALREDDGELGGNVEVIGDHLDAAIRHVRDRAVARQ